MPREISAHKTTHDLIPQTAHSSWISSSQWMSKLIIPLLKPETRKSFLTPPSSWLLATQWVSKPCLSPCLLCLGERSPQLSSCPQALTLKSTSTQATKEICLNANYDRIPLLSKVRPWLATDHLSPSHFSPLVPVCAQKEGGPFGESSQQSGLWQLVRGIWFGIRRCKNHSQVQRQGMMTWWHDDRYTWQSYKWETHKQAAVDWMSVSSQNSC